MLLVFLNRCLLVTVSFIRLLFRPASFLRSLDLFEVIFAPALCLGLLAVEGLVVEVLVVRGHFRQVERIPVKSVGPDHILGVEVHQGLLVLHGGDHRGWLFIQGLLVVVVSHKRPEHVVAGELFARLTSHLNKKFNFK